MLRRIIKRITRIDAVVKARRYLQDKLQIDISFRDPALNSRRPQVSIVVVVYNIPRESRRTLLSLCARYQRHIAAHEYEVLVVDNGSTPPVDPEMVRSCGDNFRLIRIKDASSSPAMAANRGIAEARGEYIGVMVDGARIASPGLVHFARSGARMFERSIVGALGWYLGRDYQRFGVLAGYDHAQEDQLLDSISWPNDGYRLFEIATMDESSVDGWLSTIAELNALFASRATWQLLGGLDEKFDLPGGGLVNLDTFRRAVELPDARLVLMLGEGTFHRLHGGVATNSAPDKARTNWDLWAGQYEQIRSRPYALPVLANPPAYVGTLPTPVLARLVRAAVHPAKLHNSPAPLGDGFDFGLWTAAASPRSSDPVIAQLVDLAQQQFRAGQYAAVAALSRLILKRDPREPEAGRLLSLSCPWLPSEAAPYPPQENYHLVLGEACRLFGENEAAKGHYQEALKINRDLVQAHVGLATIRLPGDFYYQWLDRLYTELKPDVVVEIGVYEGKSLAYLRPPTLAIGVDPEPRPLVPLQVNAKIFKQTSDDFFAGSELAGLLKDNRVTIGFIDGLHLFEQALKDFINLEKYCGPKSIIMFHDTLPLDEATQSRATDTQFHTGDVWKTIVCLKHYRPDLDVFTIATPWTGLTVVAGLDPGSRILADRYDEAVERFMKMPFGEVADCLDASMNVVPNDWGVVKKRLGSHGIL
ncbi:glycosyltransferase [Rhodopseudomonas sp. RCAM05734]|uniref:glycosyltransferase n=1 Tax=Rhodopseudomonas sp. RCAM05734 TaxID=3457549 RepID=UPI004044A609